MGPEYPNLTFLPQKNEVCNSYTLGKCVWGSYCHRSHGEPSESVVSQVIDEVSLFLGCILYILLTAYIKDVKDVELVIKRHFIFRSLTDGVDIG